MANPRWLIKMPKMIKPDFYLMLRGKGLSEITDHGFAILFKQILNPRWRIQDGESKMVDSRWSAKMIKMLKSVFYLILIVQVLSGISDNEFAVLFKQTFNPRWEGTWLGIHQPLPCL